MQLTERSLVASSLTAIGASVPVNHFARWQLGDVGGPTMMVSPRPSSSG